MGHTEDFEQHLSDSWDHVESALRAERRGDSAADRLVALIAQMRAAGVDRALLARRTSCALLLLTRSMSPQPGVNDPMIAFLFQRDRIICLIGATDAFHRCDI